MNWLDLTILGVVGLSVLAGVLRGLLRGVLIAAALLLVLGLSPLGKGRIWQESKIAAAWSTFAARVHSPPRTPADVAPATPTERFVHAEAKASEQSSLGHVAVKRDNARVEKTPQRKSPDEGVRWPKPLEE